MAARDFDGALQSAQRFLDAVTRRPFLRHAIWGAAGIYTLNVVAMGLNNAGAALLELGRLDESEKFLNEARRQDPAYPLPVFNLARRAHLLGDAERAAEFGAEAYELGFAGDSLDEVLAAIGLAYARVPR